MKIISGSLKGRNIKGYDTEGTRPTMDRVRESIFSMIQNYIPESIVLDLFAGCATLGLEAISNGAKLCYFNDSNRICINKINENIKDFKIGGNTIITTLDYKKALKFYKENEIKFDIVFLDPPYNMECINDIIGYIITNNLLNKDGIIVCEVDHNYLKDFNKLELIKSKKYGNKMVLIYKNISF